MEKHDTPASKIAFQHQPPDQNKEESTEKISTSSVNSHISGHQAGSSDDEYVYVTGFKLMIVMVSVTLVGFLIMLDTSIVATVG